MWRHITVSTVLTQEEIPGEGGQLKTTLLQIRKAYLLAKHSLLIFAFRFCSNFETPNFCSCVAPLGSDLIVQKEGGQKYFFYMASFYGIYSSLHIYMLFKENQHHYEYNFIIFSLHLSCPAALITI